MIIIASDFITALQCLTYSLAILPRNAVYDTAFPPEARVQELGHVRLDIFERLLITNFVDKIGAIEAALEDDDLLFDA